MTEQLYDLMVFSDGDARVYRHGHWVKGTFKGLTSNVVQTSPDKDLLIKIANMTRADYVRQYTGSDTYALKSVDQTGTLSERTAR